MANLYQLPDKNIWKEYFIAAEKFLDSILLVNGETEKSFTYREIFSKSVQVARSLIEFSKTKINLTNSFEKSRFICILLPSGEEYISSTLAVFYLGKIVVPLSSLLSEEKLKMMLNDVGNPILITNSEGAMEKMKGSYENTWIYEEKNKEIIPFETSFKEPLAQEKISFCFYTSGSTGIPKGVLISHTSVMMRILPTGRTFGTKPEDKVSLFLNHAFSLSLIETFVPLFFGAKMFLPPHHLKFDMPALRKWAREKELTHVFLVASSAEIFIDGSKEEFSEKLRFVACGGEKFRGHVREGLPFRFIVTYASTESLVISQFEVPPKYENKIIPAGLPLEIVKVKIVNKDLEEIEKGEVGEILTTSPFQSDFYHNREELNKLKFINIDGDIYVRSGDQGYILPTGELIVKDRIDNMIKINGNRFEIGDLEDAIKKYPGIDKVVVAFQKTHQRLHAFYIKAQNVVIKSNEDIRSFLTDKIPHYAMPASITCLNKFPTNSNQKVDRQSLLQMINEDKIIVQPNSETEFKLRNIWSKILKISKDEISIDANFFGLGGNSLQIGQILNELKNEKMTAVKFFANPTIQKQALIIDGNSSEEIFSVNLREEVVFYNSKLNELTFPSEKVNICTNGNILLTGATGYLGIHLLIELLHENSVDKVVCIIRANSKENGISRLINALLEFNHFKNMELARDFYERNLAKIEVICGDVLKPSLGLSETDYLEIISKVGVVFHCASEVNFFKRYEDLKLSNVDGTLNIIKFCLHSNPKTLHYISTVAIEEVEKALMKNEEVAGFLNGYRQSKWVAESMVQKSFLKGLPGTVSRPGVIGPHSKNHKILNPKDFTSLLLKQCKIVGAYPKIPFSFPYATLDFTTEAIIRATKHASIMERDVNKTDELCFNVWENIVEFEKLVDEVVEKDDVNISEVSFDNWLNLVKNDPRLQNEEAQLLFELVQLRFNDKKQVDNEIEKNIATTKRSLPVGKFV